MVNNHIVIGSNFGDEGKGLVTSYLTQGLKNSIVVRFNGGAQAGHTVELEDGRRHEFHSLGSGTLHGSDTFLTEHFIVHPILFNQEFIEVPEEYFKVFAHRDALLTTPYDWLLNQKAEEVRGAGKHGTCGMGINETVTRVAGGNDDEKYLIPRYGIYKTTLADIFNIEHLREKLTYIRDSYIPARARQRGITDYTYIQEYDIESYLESCDLMSRLVIPVGNYEVLKLYAHRVFEGAQGLALDEYHHFYPHVTRSRTGVHNATEVLNAIGETQANAHYVTRSYLTRHGEGPLSRAGEVDEKEDITNRTNKNQGALRFAPLDLNLLRESISNDLLMGSNGIAIDSSFKITWGNYQDSIITQQGYNWGDTLRDELFKVFPGMNQTWFYDKVLESAE